MKFLRIIFILNFSNLMPMDYNNEIIKQFIYKVTSLIANKESLDNPLILKKEPCCLIAFFIAKYDLDQEFLDFVMKEKINLDILDQELKGKINTPLITAIYFGNLNAVKVFLIHKANPNLVGSLNTTPLCTSIDSFSEHKYDITKMLLRFKADPNGISGKHEIPIIKAVIACWNHSKKFKKNDIHWKNQYDKILNIIKILLYYGANPYKKNSQGKNAIDIAELYGLKNIMNLLENSKEILIKKLTLLLYLGKSPFCKDVAQIVARFVYEY